MRFSIKEIITVLGLGLLSAFSVTAIPTLFSAEKFAWWFYPHGGLIHEQVGAYIVSLSFAVIGMFYKKYINYILLVSIITSTLIAVYHASRVLIDGFGIIWGRSLWVLFTLVFSFGLYTLILFLPTYIIFLQKRGVPKLGQ